MSTGPQVTKEIIQTRLDPFGSTLTEFKQPLSKNKIKFTCACGEPVEKFIDHIQRFVGLCTPCTKKRGIEKNQQTTHDISLTKVKAKLEEDGAELKTFPPAPLKRQQIIYYCKCGKEHSKNWEMIQEYGAYCDDCTLENGLEKKRNTCIVKFGYDNPNKSPIIRAKTVDTCTKRYGGPSPMSDPKVVQKAQDTLEERTGFRHSLQNPVSMEKFNETLYNHLGVTGSAQKNPDVRALSLVTVRKKYGVDNVSQNPEIHQKKQETSMNNWGVIWPMQNPDIADKSLKNSFLRKEFKCPSGRVIICQGFEPFALNMLLLDGIDENDISDVKPEIWYKTSDEKKHRYYTDIFIASRQLCIEVKSAWTFENDREVNLLKQKATQDAGYLHIIWIFSPKGELLETLT
jgi:hypothetical protein